jgi:hypothetical protein
MKLRALMAACGLLAALGACTAGPGTEAPSVSTGGDGDGDGDGRDQDASSEEREPPGSHGPDGAHADAGLSGEDAGQDAEQDAGEPGPEAPATDGVHLSVAGEPYQTATDVFYFESGGRPGIQGDFPDASLRVELSDTPGTLHCEDGGAAITYELEGGELRANTELGSCTIHLAAFNANPGAPITATLQATLERTTGEVADALHLTARIQVGHP